MGMSKGFKKEVMEKRARGMAAWGMYAVYVQQQNLDRECSELRRQLKSDGRSSREIDEKVDELQRKRVGGAHHLIIGG
ncbi:MAG: hypothetical protein US81_C0001G0015 [Parcubacteria group bacterium GW2011_GWE2_38_18]|nr:MAG: hypothetical protein US81_C0001G0015 [Parcubacteria group bacterium GW2011_GWE2_38_18]